MTGKRYVVVEKECCGTCVHCRQHYVLTKNGWPHPIWYGHCTEPRVKCRAPDEVCGHWASTENTEDGC